MIQNKRKPLINALANDYRIKARQGMEPRVMHKELRGDLGVWKNDAGETEPFVLQDREVWAVVNAAYHSRRLADVYRMGGHSF